MTTNQDLFNYIDSIEMEMEYVKTQFFLKWNELIMENLYVKDDFSIEQVLDLCGGYWLEEHSYNLIDKSLKTFYEKRAKKQCGKCFLRGYDYYQCDPLMHCSGSMKSSNDLWCLFKKKWDNYPKNISFEYLNEDLITMENWIATLGLLEYLFADLTTLQWYAYKNEITLSYKMNELYYTALNEIEQYADEVGHAIACALVFDFKGACSILTDNYTRIICSKNLDAMMRADIIIKDKSSVRAIREGDSLSLIYAAYLMKLEPFCKKHGLRRIELASNAFGAMNIGIILKYLISPNCEANSYNVLYAQNRAVEDVAFGYNSLDTCRMLGTHERGCRDITTIVVDDSIFSGNSYRNIRDYLDIGQNILLLPLTLNCDCIKFCRRGISEADDVELIARHVVDWAFEVGNSMPPFSSFWDFERKAFENGVVTDNQELRKVLDGDDLMLKHLWVTFSKDILQSRY